MRMILSRLRPFSIPIVAAVCFTPAFTSADPFIEQSAEMFMNSNQPTGPSYGELRAKFFAKTRLMRRIEAPEPGDSPLTIGNPFDRPWRKFPSIDPMVSRGGLGEQRSPGGATRKTGRSPCPEPQALH